MVRALLVVALTRCQQRAKRFTCSPWGWLCAMGLLHDESKKSTNTIVCACSSIFSSNSPMTKWHKWHKRSSGGKRGTITYFFSPQYFPSKKPCRPIHFCSDRIKGVVVLVMLDMHWAFSALPMRRTISTHVKEVIHIGEQLQCKHTYSHISWNTQSSALYLFRICLPRIVVLWANSQLPVCASPIVTYPAFVCLRPSRLPIDQTCNSICNAIDIHTHSEKRMHFMMC